MNSSIIFTFYFYCVHKFELPIKGAVQNEYLFYPFTYNTYNLLLNHNGLKKRTMILHAYLRNIFFFFFLSRPYTYTIIYHSSLVLPKKKIKNCLPIIKTHAEIIYNPIIPLGRWKLRHFSPLDDTINYTTSPPSELFRECTWRNRCSIMIYQWKAIGYTQIYLYTSMWQIYSHNNIISCRQTKEVKEMCEFLDDRSIVFIYFHFMYYTSRFHGCMKCIIAIESVNISRKDLHISYTIIRTLRFIIGLNG